MGAKSIPTTITSGNHICGAANEDHTAQGVFCSSLRKSTHMEALEEETGNYIAWIYEHRSREKDAGNKYISQLGSPKRWDL